MAETTPNFRPLYAQVKDLLVQRLVRGDWGPGEPLPTETALAEEFKVSHGTVRKALDKLAADVPKYPMLARARTLWMGED